MGRAEYRLQPEGARRADRDECNGNVRSGSIVVFHDSAKASKNLYYALPRVLEYLSEQGYEMASIPMKKYVADRMWLKGVSGEKDGVGGLRRSLSEELGGLTVWFVVGNRYNRIHYV